MLLIGQADNLPFSFSFGFFPLYRCQDREVCFFGTTIYTLFTCLMTTEIAHCNKLRQLACIRLLET